MPNKQACRASSKFCLSDNKEFHNSAKHSVQQRRFFSYKINYRSKQFMLKIHSSAKQLIFLRIRKTNYYSILHFTFKCHEETNSKSAWVHNTSLQLVHYKKYYEIFKETKYIYSQWGRLCLFTKASKLPLLPHLSFWPTLISHSNAMKRQVLQRLQEVMGWMRY